MKHCPVCQHGWDEELAKCLNPVCGYVQPDGGIASVAGPSKLPKPEDAPHIGALRILGFVDDEDLGEECFCLQLSGEDWFLDFKDCTALRDFLNSPKALAKLGLVDETEKLRGWMELANARIASLNRQVFDDGNQATALRNLLAEQAKKVRGIHGIGTLVKVAASDFNATVREVAITKGGVEYLVSWWFCGERREEWVDESEVEPFQDDILPVPGNNDGVH